jgi:hypothetical protein
MLAIEVLDWRIVNRGAWSLTSYTGLVAGHLVANDWRIARDVIAIESAVTFTTREVARDHVRPESSGFQFQHRGRTSTSSGVYAKCISSALKLGADEVPGSIGHLINAFRSVYGFPMSYEWIRSPRFPDFATKADEYFDLLASPNSRSLFSQKNPLRPIENVQLRGGQAVKTGHLKYNNAFREQLISRFH